MIYYNPKDWFLGIFKIHKADTFRALLPLLIFTAVYSGSIVYLEKEYLQLSDNSYAKNITIMHTLLGFAISMLLVFRTNTAYDRWWEGRKLWGSLVNNSRNLAIKLKSILPDDDIENKNFFTKIIALYAITLSRHLKKESTLHALDDSLQHTLPTLQNTNHAPNTIAIAMFKKIQLLYQHKIITGDNLIILNGELQSFTDICGACERIKNTPIPFSYSSFIKKFIFIYVLTLPFGLAFNLGYYAIPVTVFIFYVLASLELIAEEIEDPFGKDSNDLPMEKISQNIKQNVEEIFG